MNKQFNTGEMINALTYELFDREAVTVDKKYRAKITEHGMLVITNNQGTVGLNANVLNSIWEISPKYISFEEAMDALKNNIDVILILEDEKKPEKTLFRSCFHLETREGITFKDMFEGKWLIHN